MKLLFILATLLSVAPVKSSKIYHKDWIDFNKNGVNDLLSTESPYIWPASKHAWALNQVQKLAHRENPVFVIEQS